jgi:MFS family permease
MAHPTTGLAVKRAYNRAPMKALLPLSPLLAAAAILLAGNGLQGTLITLRAGQEGFGASLIGLMGAGYYAGFLLSCLFTARLIRAVGHIRVFAGLAAIAASASLTMVLWIDPFSWIGLRFLTGYCFAGLFMVVDSWLNAAVSNEARARTLSVYRMVDLAAVTGSQFLLPVFGAGGFPIFAIMAILICMSLVPISLMDRSSPTPPEETKFSIAAVWAISPLACLGCITIGLTNSTFRLMGPSMHRKSASIRQVWPPSCRLASWAGPPCSCRWDGCRTGWTGAGC